IMKTMLVALVLVLVLNYGEICTETLGGTRCTQTQETCGFGKDACIVARFNFPPCEFNLPVSFTLCSKRLLLKILPHNNYHSLRYEKCTILLKKD
uniref:Uncharacterized protein n=1 Tax=Cyprinus carpio TaxID=7962 RepID=A0A8C1QPQ6_CYPCA